MIQPLLVGHRGSRGVGVENTREAFQEGINRGYHALECDIRVSKDVEFVIFHDETLERMAPHFALKSNPITSFTYDELKQIPLVQNVNGKVLTGYIPLLRDYLRLCKINDVSAIIELKWSTGINNNDQHNITKLLHLIEEEGMLDKVTILTSMKNCLAYIRCRNQTLPLQLLIGGHTPVSEENITFAINNQLSLDVEKSVLTKDLVDTLHSHQLEVNCWTVNDESLFNQLKDWNVDYVTTDVL
jgi:glycerophosphoryl diester phosphodiesterase